MEEINRGKNSKSPEYNSLHTDDKTNKTEQYPGDGRKKTDTLISKIKAKKIRLRELKKENKIAEFGRVAWLYTKYQIITKGLLLAAVFNISSAILNYLIRASGRSTISSGDYKRFLLSFQGVGALILGIVLVIFLIGTDINGFIIMSALIKEKRIKMTARNMLIAGIKSLKSFLRPSGILIILYVAAVVPLAGIGLAISPMEDFQIPKFITSVIFGNRLYTIIYYTIIAGSLFVSLRYIFLFHYILILGNRIGEGLRNASNLMKKHWKEFLIDFLLQIIIMTLFISGVVAVIMGLTVLPAHMLSISLLQTRVWTIMGIMLVGEFSTFIALMTVPFICFRLTVLFYRYNEKDGLPVSIVMNVKADRLGDEAFFRVKLTTKVCFIILFLSIIALNFLVAWDSGVNFDDIYRKHKEIDIVAHRGGGNLAAENSIAGLEAAIEEGVAWSETDIQRTKDGYYIINHDRTFKRLTGVKKAPKDMTIEEISKLRIKDKFNIAGQAQKVATPEEFLDTAKGKIGLFLELKGKTADTKMADDVIAMVKARDMEKDVVILVSSYKLVNYIEDKYPEIQTGFLYFFVLGKISDIRADVLIMEEREATPEKVHIIHRAGKKSYVWTVNSKSSMERFVDSDVDGIITDYIRDVKAAIRRRDDRTDIEIIMESFINRN
ncbi:hypothetical protein HMPREF9333_01082 [Johnsonella ignava ATCC 51276]|uniref:GP-PDE domain-containing protein n=1 Tax=Johnsonella ignava ATCC 51276 TaxID=679200 RepID=G5GHP2_9FIRM|nr:glycerophosphodiester phosphodiesterase family protein [Johnsonella ignava]EHI55735.1 hypothetical protein HMPREF9333_01082 [Johnsonella ignava ATCC 51276]